MTSTLLTACSNSSNDPVAIAEKFTHAYFINHDVNEYAQFLKTETRESLLSPNVAEYNKKQQEAVQALKFTCTLDKEKTVISEKMAEIYFDVKSAVNPKHDRKSKHTHVRLKKNSDGKWFVDYYTFPTRFDY